MQALRHRKPKADTAARTDRKRGKAMIINLICLAGGFICGFFTAALMVSASSYDDEVENYEDKDPK